MGGGSAVYKSLGLILLLLIALQTVPGHSQVAEPVVVPAADQNVPNNTRENVTYSCSVAAGLNLVWQVDNLQITARMLPAFLDLGIITRGPDGSTLVFTEDALREVGEEYEVRCVAFSPTLSSSLSDPLFVRVFGPPGPVVGLDVLPSSDRQVLVTWGRPPGFIPDISINYTVVVDSFQTEEAPVNETTSSTSLPVTESAGPDCVRHLFTVTALNLAGFSEPVSINESIPISPDLSATDSSLSILYVNVSSSLSGPEIAVTFEGATSCSVDFSVTSHSVVVRRREGGGEDGGGEEVGRAPASPYSDLLRGVVMDLPRDTPLIVEVEACNVLLCRTSRTIEFLTTDVQTASILFFETFVSIGCTFAAESQALGCVVTLELGEEGEGGGGGEGVGRETFWLQRERGSSDVSQCNRTANSRVAYQVISAVDWESDGSLGSQSVPVTVNETDNSEDFPCDIDDGGGGDEGLSSGAVAGIVIGVAVFVVIVMGAALVGALLCYRRTRDVRRKPNGAISIEERALIPRAERRNITELNTTMSVPASYTPSTTDNRPKLEPSMSLPPNTTTAVDNKPQLDTGTLRSTVSLPVPNMQASLDCGPVGEIHIPRGKRGKIHMHIWSDTLERCKRTGKTKFQLLPLLDEEHETNTEASRM